MWYDLETSTSDCVNSRKIWVTKFFSDAVRLLRQSCTSSAMGTSSGSQCIFCCMCQASYAQGYWKGLKAIRSSNRDICYSLIIGRLRKLHRSVVQLLPQQDPRSLQPSD